MYINHVLLIYRVFIDFNSYIWYNYYGDVMYTIKLDEFEGPLDLLLHLVKEKNMDIENLDIDIITDDYLNYIKNASDINLNIESDYLVFAAELIRIKALSIFDAKDNEEEEEILNKEDLISKLLEYKAYKDNLPTIKDGYYKRLHEHDKMPENLNNYFNIEAKEDSGEYDVTLLTNALNKLIERALEKKPLETKIVHREISVKARKSFIKSKLKSNSTIEFDSLFEDYSKDLVVATFIALLEMVRSSEVTVIQDNHLDSIYIKGVAYV